MIQSLKKLLLVSPWDVGESYTLRTPTFAFLTCLIEAVRKINESMKKALKYN